MSRESLLGRTMVELADTLVDDFDVVDLLILLTDRCVELLDVATAGIMLVSPDGSLRVLASSSEAMRVLELFELQAEQGPCLDCFRTGEPLMNQELTPDNPWPEFATEARAAGFGSVHAIPMRLRGTIIGALNLFGADTSGLDDDDTEVARALADIATIAILQSRTVRDVQLVNEQLQNALNSRVVIEQAKGMIAERTGLDMERSFRRLRQHARDQNLRLVDLARDVIDGRVGTGTFEPLPTAPASDAQH